MQYIDLKYINLISNQLVGFTKKSNSPFVANFRCILCGDSHLNQNKKRGYLYEKKGEIHYHCHNCGASHKFSTILKKLSPHLYDEYKLEKMINQDRTEIEQETIPVSSIINTIKLPSIDQLSTNHIAYKYIADRQIPKKFWNEIYYTPDFSSFVKDIYPSYDKKLYHEPRIIFPFYSIDKQLQGFTGRAIGSSDKKYMIVKFNQDAKVFGLQWVNLEKKIYVVEGPIDSMFINNSLATMDASLYNIIPSLGKRDYIFVYDNQPRNKDIVRNISKTIELGYPVCLWPEYMEYSGKDINEYVLNGYNSSEIMSIIDQNTYSGMTAQLELIKWKKLDLYQSQNPLLMK